MAGAPLEPPFYTLPGIPSDVVGGVEGERYFRAQLDPEVTVDVTASAVTVEKVAHVINHQLDGGNGITATTAVAANWRLNRAEFQFTTRESRSIILRSTLTGAELLRIDDSTDLEVTVDGEDDAFRQGDELEIEVTGTAADCVVTFAAFAEQSLPGLAPGDVTGADRQRTSDANTTRAVIAPAGFWPDADPTVVAGDLCDFPTTLITAFSDVDLLLRVYVSDDGGLTFNSGLPFRIRADRYEIHRLVLGPRVVRVVVENDTVDTPTVVQVTTYFGDYGPLTAPINLNIAADADAAVVRNLPADIDIVLGRHEGFFVLPQFGAADNVPNGVSLAAPHDIWAGGGPYTGFPTGAPDYLEFVSTDAADTGLAYYSALVNATDTEYTTQFVQLNGTTPVRTATPLYRCAQVAYVDFATGVVNAGTITCRQESTPANVFAAVRPGFGQTTVCGYTIPAQTRGIIRRLSVNVAKSNAAVVEGAIWVREPTVSPRLIRAFSAANDSEYVDEPYGGVVLSAGTDIFVRLTACSANGVDVFATLDLLMARDSLQ